MPDPRKLPEMLAVVAAAAGEEAALRLARAFGGTRKYFPKRMGPDHPIARCVGMAGADALVARFGHGHVYVPLGPGSAFRPCTQDVLELIDGGATTAEIVQRLHVSRRTVERARRRAGGAP